MLTRCFRPTASNYAAYGGSGITVCERWRHSFENFFSDMGTRPIGTTLDRWPNQNGPYEPDNCRWATPLEQVNNRGDNVMVTIDGKQMTVSDACRAAGSLVTADQARRRIQLGWTPEKAVTFPLRYEKRMRRQIVAPT